MKILIKKDNHIPDYELRCTHVCPKCGSVLEVNPDDVKHVTEYIFCMNCNQKISKHSLTWHKYYPQVEHPQLGDVEDELWSSVSAPCVVKEK